MAVPDNVSTLNTCPRHLARRPKIHNVASNHMSGFLQSTLSVATHDNQPVKQIVFCSGHEITRDERRLLNFDYNTKLVKAERQWKSPLSLLKLTHTSVHAFGPASSLTTS